MSHKWKNIFLLSIAPLIWGLGFIGTRWALEDYSASWCHAIRFVLCLSFVLPYLIYKKTFLQWDAYVKPGIILGFFLSMGLWTQTIGIGQTSVAKAGFFTVFYAFFTPFLGMIFLKQRYRKLYWFLVFLALLGIAFLCELKMTNFNRGDLFIVLSAVIFSLHILLLDKYAIEKTDSLQLNFMQTLIIAMMSVIIAISLEQIPSVQPLLDFTMLTKPSALSGFLMISVLSTIIGFSIQVYAQKYIEPHIASLIFLLESISAAFFGYYFLNEKLSLIAIIGSLFVLVSVALVPLTFNDR